MNCVGQMWGYTVQHEGVYCQFRSINLVLMVGSTAPLEDQLEELNTYAPRPVDTDHHSIFRNA